MIWHLRMTHLSALTALCVVVCANAADAAKASRKPAAEPARQEALPDRPNDLPQVPTLACAGPFARDTSHTKLAAEFGARNVTFKDVTTPGNILMKATVIFDDDPTRRVTVFWSNPKARAQPSAILVEAPSVWSGPGGIRNGLPLKEMEKLNGGGFSMVGFGGVNGGVVSDLKGVFAAVPGDCTLKIRFEPGIANPLPAIFASITGDRTVSSTNLLLRRARPQVIAWSVNYR